MSDNSSVATPEPQKDWFTEHREMYLRSGGAKGHIMDLAAGGGHPFTMNCLLKFQGRKSGKIFITPLIFGNFGGEVVIVASKGGSDNHPDWYLNICASDAVEFQVGTQAFRGSWREPQGAERAKIWDFMVGVFPPYARYQTSTNRQIPLVMMKAVEPIAVFEEADATGMPRA